MGDRARRRQNADPRAPFRESFGEASRAVDGSVVDDHPGFRKHGLFQNAVCKPAQIGGFVPRRGHERVGPRRHAEAGPGTACGMQRNAHVSG